MSASANLTSKPTTRKKSAARKKPTRKRTPAKPSRGSKKPTTRKKSAARGPGRPAGSKTAAAEVVAAIPPACSSCGSTDLVVVKGSAPRTVTHAGEYQGQRYSAVVFRRKRCQNCGNILSVKTYENPATEKTQN